MKRSTIGLSPESLGPGMSPRCSGAALYSPCGRWWVRALMVASSFFVFALWNPSATAQPAQVSNTESSALEQLTVARIQNEKAQAKYYDAKAADGSPLDLFGILQTVIGGVLALGGGVAVTWWTRRADERKSKSESARIYLRQKNQLRLAVSELLIVLKRIQATSGKPKFLEEKLLYEVFTRPDSSKRNADYYLKHDLVTTVYLLCSLLGWLELYRTEPSFLRGPEPETSDLEKCFRDIRQHLAQEVERQSGQQDWRDGFVLESDQRAIGEKMLTKARGRTDVVVGYAAFCENLFREPAKDNPTRGERCQDWWVWNVTRFFVELDEKNDFTRWRIDRMVDDLEKLFEVVGGAHSSGTGRS